MLIEKQLDVESVVRIYIKRVRWTISIDNTNMSMQRKVYIREYAAHIYLIKLLRLKHIRGLNIRSRIHQFIIYGTPKGK